MKTLEELKDRSRVEIDEKGREHWIYAGCCTRGVPWVNYTDPKTGKRTTMAGLRAAWLMKHRRDPGERRIVRIDACQFPLCVHPDCCTAMTNKQWGKSRVGKVVGRIGQRKGGLKAIEARRVVTPELASKILASTESAPKVAAKLGLKPWHVRDVRTGRNSMAQGAFAGMFSSLVR